MGYLISGIQQMGVGIKDVYASFEWYRTHLGFDMPVFDEAATAEKMLPYTDNKPQDRHAILALNMQGGGGLEIWQYVNRTPQPANFDVVLGDLGIYIAKVKARDVQQSYAALKSKGVKLLTEVVLDPVGKPHFYLEDPFGNIFEIVESQDFLAQNERTNGGIFGASIGVSDMDKSIHFYKSILGYDTVVYDESGIGLDLKGLPNGQDSFRRVLLRHSKPRQGAFSPLLGSSEVELFEAKNHVARPIFKDRLWGDLGFIHLCFDVRNMASLKENCNKMGHPFTVESDPDFDMGEAAGQFTYIEDPDGTLIEFVETFKVPIMKKIGWFLDLRKRDGVKPLPKWMLKAMGWGRKKGKSDRQLSFYNLI